MELVNRIDSKLCRELEGTAVVYGRVSNTWVNQRGKKPSTCFEGLIRLAEEKDGKLVDKCQSRRCYLPTIAADALAIACEAAEDASDDGLWSVDFGFVLTTIDDPESQTGYRWACTPFLAEEDRPDMLARIAAQFTPPKLPAGSRKEKEREKS